MSGADRTEQLAAELARDLIPVRPIPPLRGQLALLALAVIATLALASLWLGLRPLEVFGRSGTSAALAAALLGLAGGGLVAALALRIPGRESVVRWAATAASSALALLAVLLGAALVDSEGPGPLPALLACWYASVVLALPSGLAALWLARRGAPWRPMAGALALTGGAVATGALLAHSGCPSGALAHWVFGHALLPIATGLAAGVLVGRAFERARRRASMQ